MRNNRKGKERKAKKREKEVCPARCPACPCPETPSPISSMPPRIPKSTDTTQMPSNVFVYFSSTLCCTCFKKTIMVDHVLEAVCCGCLLCLICPPVRLLCLCRRLRPPLRDSRCRRGLVHVLSWGLVGGIHSGVCGAVPLVHARNAWVGHAAGLGLTGRASMPQLRSGRLLRVRGLLRLGRVGRVAVLRRLRRGRPHLIWWVVVVVLRRWRHSSGRT